LSSFPCFACSSTTQATCSAQPARSAAPKDGWNATGAFAQALEDGVELLVHIFGLRQRGRVGGDEGQFKDARQRLAEQRLAGAGRADQQDVALQHFEAADVGHRYLAEMRIDGDGEDLLRLVLADHVAVQLGNDFTRFHRGIPWRKFTTDDKLRKSGLNDHAAIVKAAPKLRQHFCPFLRVDRDKADHRANCRSSS
jgi:hypothetical protein